MPGPRDYTRSTIFTLATLGEGRCYWPAPPCNAPVTVIINGEPVSNLQVAHIRAAKLNGPRYVPDMSDDERRSWKNLILLCTPHHNMIDKIKPGDYSIEDLERWKSGRETGGLARLKGLTDLTEDRLQEMLAYSVKEAHKEIRDMLAEHRPIDPDAAMLLSEAADHLNMDTAEALYDASSMLAPALNEYAEMLDHAASGLTPALNEHAEMLYQAASTLAPVLGEPTETLYQAARMLTPALNEHAETLYQAASMLTPALDEHAETLYQAARMLTSALNEHAEMLDQVASTLTPALNEHAETLSDATSNLPGLIEQPGERIWELRRLQGDM